MRILKYISRFLSVGKIDLHARLLGMVVFFILMPVILMTFFSTQYLEGELNRKQERYLQSTLAVALSEMQQRQEDIRRVALCMAEVQSTQDAILSHNSDLLVQKLTLLRKNFNKIDYAVMLDSGNRIIAKSDASALSRTPERLVVLNRDAILMNSPITSTETIPLSDLFAPDSKEYKEFSVALKNKLGENSHAFLQQALCEITLVPIFDNHHQGRVLGSIVLIGICNSDYYFPNYVRSRSTDGFLVLTVNGIRVSTQSTQGEDRSWMVGTRAEHIMDARPQPDGSYYGHLELQGKTYLFIDQPIKNYDDHVVGYISYGLPEEHFSNIIEDNRKLTLMIGGLCFLVFAPLAQLMAAQLRHNQEQLEQLVQHRTKDLRAAIEEMKQLDDTKSRFLSNITHELRTPLCVIINACDFLKGNYCGTLNEKQYKYVNNAYECGNHLLALINDLLDLSRLNSGRKLVNYSTFSIRDSIESTVREMHSFRPDDNIAIETEYDPSDFIITADAQMLKQIIYNLLSNALKFSHPDSTVTISVFRRDGQAEIIVKDRGIGISPENQARVFNEFEQADNPLTKKYAGTGLGLPIVKKLVNLMGGNVFLKSELGKGTEILFTLPLEPAENGTERNENIHG